LRRFVGRKVDEHRGALLLSHPMEHGHVRDWGDMELLWRHCFSELGGGGGGRAAEARPLLLTTAPQTPRAAREAAAQVLFEALRVPALCLAPTSTLALYATGRTTGLVLECGEGVTAATPVYEGYALPHAAVRADYGGGEVTEELAVLLRRAGVALSTTAEREAIRGLKEAAAHVALDPARAEASARDGSSRGSSSTSSSSSSSISSSSSGGGSGSGSGSGGAGGAAGDFYTLPDGTRLRLGAELFRAPEVLFNPALVGSEAPGVAACIAACVARCDMDLRRAQLGAIVLAGGSTALRGFPQRLLAEVRRAAPAEAKVAVWAPGDRKVLTWVGGSILASLSTFRSMWVTRQQWEEEGPEALQRRGALML
jgi:centractin